MPPQVTPIDPLDVHSGPLDDEHLLNRRGVSHSFVNSRLEGERSTLAIAAVSRDDEFGFSIVDPSTEAFCREPTEHNGVNRPDPRTREHSDNGFGDKRHVNRNAIAVTDTKAGEQVCCLAHFVCQFAIRNVARVARFTFEVQRDAITNTGFDVSVKAVVGNVEGAIGKPLSNRCIRPIEYLSERFVPVKFACLTSPKRETVGCCFLVELGLRDGIRGKRLTRRKTAIFVKQCVNRCGHHRPIRVVYTAQLWRLLLFYAR